MNNYLNRGLTLLFYCSILQRHSNSKVLERCVFGGKGSQNLFTSKDRTVFGNMLLGKFLVLSLVAHC